MLFPYVPPPMCLSADHELVEASQEGVEVRRSAASIWARPLELRRVPPPFNSLPPEIGYALLDRWQRPCEAAFEWLAQNHPKALLRLIESGSLAPADLTFAAEIAGTLAEQPAARAALLPLLDHDDAIVREGAVYGLASCLDDSVRERLKVASGKDRSRAVREAAIAALSDDC